MTKLNKKSAVVVVMTVLALLIVLVGWLGYEGMTKGEEGLRNTYENEVVQFVHLDEVCDAYNETIVDNCHKVLTGEYSFAKARAHITNAIAAAELGWKSYLAGRLESKEQSLAAKVESLKGPVDAAMVRLLDILDKEDRAALEKFHARDLHLATEPYCERLSKLSMMQQDDAADTVTKTERTFTTMKAILAASMVWGLIIAALLTAYLIQIQSNLQKSEQLFRSMFETHNAAMMLIAPSSGTIVDANQAAVTFYGLSRSTLQSMSASGLNLVPKSEEPPRKGRNRLGGNDDTYEVSTRLGSGEIREVEVHASSIRMQGRHLVFAILHDISTRKELERQLLEFNDQDRWRVGLDLRDILGGTLAGAAMGAKTLLKTLSRNSLPGTDLAEEIVQQLNEAVTQSRSISRGLCSTSPDGPGLISELKELATNVEQVWGVRCEFIVSEDIKFLDDVRPPQLFRIAQEAVKSAINHGRAKNLTIHLGQRDGRIVLKVASDGRPLPDRPHISSCREMCSMMCRASAIGGRLEFEENQKGKVLVSCTLPKEQA